MPGFSSRIIRPERAHRPLLAGIALAALLAACSAQVDTRGNLPDPDRLAKIAPGKQTKTEVEALLGTPSSVAAFDSETWYYISRRTEKVAFLPPETVDQKVVAIRFDPSGRVQDVRVLGNGDRQEIDLVDRKTHTAGNELSLIQQLLGNVGRFEGANQPGGRK